MKNNEIKNSEFEKTLKNKMDELASSVDCFDKISKRAFPESDAGHSNDEFAICDLDNITGKKNNFRFMSFAAIAAAFVLCLFFLPKNDSFMSFVVSHFGEKSDKKAFLDVVSEIKEETSDGTYTYFDCTLEEYIENDILVNPLYRCPFEPNDNDDIMVRVFVKTHNNVATNQVYAVEYKNDYEDGNFIAVADSQAKFTDEELAGIGTEIPELNDKMFHVFQLSSNIFTIDNNCFLAGDGDLLSPASYTYNCYYKSDNGIFSLCNEVLYCRKNLIPESTYMFDISSVNVTFDESFIVYSTDNVPEMKNDWNNVVYYDGTSAEAEEASKMFLYTDLNGSETDNKDVYDPSELMYLKPYKTASDKYPITTISVSYGVGTQTKSSVLAPLNPKFHTSFRILIPGNYDNNINLSTSHDNEADIPLDNTKYTYIDIIKDHTDNYLSPEDIYEVQADINSITKQSDELALYYQNELDQIKETQDKEALEKIQEKIQETCYSNVNLKSKQPNPQ